MPQFRLMKKATEFLITHWINKFLLENHQLQTSLYWTAYFCLVDAILVTFLCHMICFSDRLDDYYHLVKVESRETRLIL